MEPLTSETPEVKASDETGAGAQSIFEVKEQPSAVTEAANHLKFNETAQKLDPKELLLRWAQLYTAPDAKEAAFVYKMVEHKLLDMQIKLLEAACSDEAASFELKVGLVGCFWQTLQVKGGQTIGDIKQYIEKTYGFPAKYLEVHFEEYDLCREHGLCIPPYSDGHLTDDVKLVHFTLKPELTVTPNGKLEPLKQPPDGYTATYALIDGSILGYHTYLKNVNVRNGLPIPVDFQKYFPGTSYRHWFKMGINFGRSKAKVMSEAEATVLIKAAADAKAAS